MEKSKKPASTKKTALPEKVGTIDPSPKQTVAEFFKEEGLPITKKDDGFEPTWNDLELFAQMMRIKYNGNGG